MSIYKNPYIKKLKEAKESKEWKQIPNRTYRTPDSIRISNNSAAAIRKSGSSGGALGSTGPKKPDIRNQSKNRIEMEEGSRKKVSTQKNPTAPARGPAPRPTPKFSAPTPKPAATPPPPPQPGPSPWPESRYQSSNKKKNPIEKIGDGIVKYGGELLDGVQDGLELTGAFPGIGILPDTVNAIIHVSRGNTNETNWAVAAMLPATGIAATIGKRAKKTAKLVKAAKLTKGPAKGNRVMKGLRKTAKEFMGKGVKDGAVKVIDDTIDVSRKKIEKFAEIKPKAPKGGKAPRRKNRFEKPSGTSDGGKGNKTKGNVDAIIKNGKISVEDIKANPQVFSGKSTEDIASMLRDSGYDVTIKNSTRSRSGAEIIKINNQSGTMNIAQVQVSPGGGRHGANPYVKISTTDQGIIKIIDGPESLYKTDGMETTINIFTGGN